jgi:ligand-binding SRPBCC domain-containing protein
MTKARGPMEIIRMTTQIKAPVDRCFKLSTTIDLDLAAANSTDKSVIDGVADGLGYPMTHQIRMEDCRPHTFFRDVMVEGAFKFYQHDHYFAPMNDGTRIRDELRFAARPGPLGRLVEKLFLRRRLIKLLRRRNALLKKVAESDEWRRYIKDESSRSGGSA